MSELKLVSKNLKQTKCDTTSIRQNHLMSQTLEVNITENTKLFFFIRRLITIEKHI